MGVAVKIRYPDLAPAVATDLLLVRIALWLFGRIFPGWPLHLMHCSERCAIASRVVDAWLDMLLDAGLVHGDPHAGKSCAEPTGRCGSSTSA